MGACGSSLGQKRGADAGPENLRELAVLVDELLALRGGNWGRLELFRSGGRAGRGLSKPAAVEVGDTRRERRRRPGGVRGLVQGGGAVRGLEGGEPAGGTGDGLGVGERPEGSAGRGAWGIRRSGRDWSSGGGEK